ncbi:leucine zipper protein 1-like isoform X2 [Symsagittifera roscoffensis]|uniref:leucine zipper protein 1-like isoform X2 n=1 Tax=Symsagittifera roscoffensis TaxID=84072 RepID=UPI00307BBBEA
MEVSSGRCPEKGEKIETVASEQDCRDDTTGEFAAEDSNRTNIVFYWFHQDDNSEQDVDVRIFIPENDSYIGLNFDPVGEVYESLPFPVPTGIHIGQLQILNKTTQTKTAATTTTTIRTANKKQEVEEELDYQQYTLTQHQLAPFEVTRERTRIIVKSDPNMKPIELPVPRSSAVTLSPGKTEVKWNRTAESLFEPTFLASLTTNDTNHDDYDSGFSNERRRTSDSRTDTRDPHESTLGSIDEILKKFSNISALSMNGFNEHESEPTESYARLPDITINGNSEQKLDIKLNSYRSNSKSDEIALPTGTAANKQLSLLEEKISSLEKAKNSQSNEIIILKTKLLEAERILKEQRELNHQKTERENRYQSLHDENTRLTEELRNLKSECENTLSHSTAQKLATVENSSMAIIKRMEYLENEVKLTRKRYENTKDELQEKSRLFEKLIEENERLRMKLGEPEKPSFLLEKIYSKNSKNVDFAEDALLASHNSSQPESTTIRSRQSQLAPAKIGQSQERNREIQTPLTDQDSFTSNNLKFLRERLVELRQKNEKLQEKYHQVQSSLPEDAGEMQNNISNLETEHEHLVSVFDEADREIESMINNIAHCSADFTLQEKFTPTRRARGSEDSERDLTLRELEELRDHLASVKAQVKGREESNGMSEKSRSGVIGRLKKPSELFASLQAQPETMSVQANKYYESQNGHAENRREQRSKATDDRLPKMNEKLFVDTNHKIESGDGDATDNLLTATSAIVIRDDFGVAYGNVNSAKATKVKQCKLRRTRSTRPRNIPQRRERTSSYSGSSTSSEDSGKRSSNRKFTNGFDADQEARRDNRDVITEEPNLFGFRAESNPNDSNDMRLSIDVLSSYRNDDADRSISHIWNLPLNQKPLSSNGSRTGGSTRQTRSFCRPPESGRPYVPKTPSDMSVGDKIKFSRTGGKISQGIVKYIGTLPSRSDYYLGVELIDAEGKHDGTFQDHRYFTCVKNKGVFVSFKKIVMCYTQ